MTYATFNYFWTFESPKLIMGASKTSENLCKNQEIHINIGRSPDVILGDL